MKHFIRGAGLLLLAIGSSAVMAVPIAGDIAFTGSSTVTGTTITFVGNDADVLFADGNFADQAVLAGDTAVFNPLDYSLPFGGVTPLWTVGGFSFDLLTVTTGPTGPGVSLSLFGTGTLMNVNYDDTAYDWSYSGNAVGGGTLQVFSSTSAPTSVPEPGSLALLGLGLLGFAVKGYGRRRVQA